MKLKDLVRKNRSYRRFDQNYHIGAEKLHSLISLAQYSASARNDQPLKFWLSNTKEMNQTIFSHLSWAGDLKGWAGPQEGERPSAYILIFGDTEIRPQFGVDHGIAAQSITLGATEAGLGGCLVGSINRDELRRELEIPERYQILLAIALGKPAEDVVVEMMSEEGSTTYYRDEHETHYVPKRQLAELIVHDVE